MSNRKPLARKKILVVDDELDVRIYVRTLFETSGYAPVVTRNGKEGLEKAKEISPDLIILDVMMPEAGGVSMYRKLKTDQDLKDIPVCIERTCYPDEERHAIYRQTIKRQQRLYEKLIKNDR